jgi:hypothetical protein
VLAPVGGASSRRLARLLPAALVAAALGYSPAASAQPSKLDKDAARTLVYQGDERMRKRDYDGARKAYERAHEIMQVPTTGIELARAHLWMGQLVEAKQVLEGFAHDESNKGEPAVFAKTRRDARELLDKLAKRIPRVKLELEGEELDPEAQGANITVMVDDVPVIEWQGDVDVNPGSHELVVAAPGYLTAIQTFDLAEGASASIAVKLEREPPSASPAASAPAADAPESSSMPWVLTGVGFGAAALFGTIGAVTGAMSLSDASSVSDQCAGDACPPTVADDLDRSRTLAHVSTTMFVLTGVGAVLGGVGLYLVVSDDDADATGDDGTDADAAVLLGPTHAALRLRF